MQLCILTFGNGAEGKVVGGVLLQQYKHSHTSGDKLSDYAVTITIQHANQLTPKAILLRKPSTHEANSPCISKYQRLHLSSSYVPSVFSVLELDLTSVRLMFTELKNPLLIQSKAKHRFKVEIDKFLL